MSTDVSVFTLSYPLLPVLEMGAKHRSVQVHPYLDHSFGPFYPQRTYAHIWKHELPMHVLCLYLEDLVFGLVAHMSSLEFAPWKGHGPRIDEL